MSNTPGLHISFRVAPDEAFARAIEERFRKKPVSAAEYSAAAKHDRAALDKLTLAVEEVLEHLEGFEDCDAGKPNLALTVADMLRTALGRRP